MRPPLDILRDRLAHVEERINDACRRAGRSRSDVTLIAVTKTVSAEVTALLPELGIRDLGESRPQVLWEKVEAVPDVRWHMLGHLQRNKIDRTVPLLHTIHSIDSVRLLKALDTYGKKQNQRIIAMLEFNCSGEKAKGGFSLDMTAELTDIALSLSHVDVQGVMTMAAYHDDPLQCRPTFEKLREIRDQLQSDTGLSLPTLSMGMSNDYEVAIEEGATHIRLGTTLFEGISIN